MGRFYAESQIKVTMGQTRTIMVNVMGEVKAPGTYTLSAFSTVFHALYMAGGINDLGTLRNIKVTRGGRQISVIDDYEFILNGRLAGNVRLQDNDVIQVGTYDCIVDITGCVKRPMAYEMRNTESLSTLLRYSGGFTGDAYKRLLRVLRKSEELKSVYNVDEFELNDFKVTDGDSVIVDAIINRYKDMVEIKGAVFRPGMYRLGGKVTSVRSLIEIAAGLSEEAMPSHGVMRRMKADRTQEVLSVDIEGILNGTTPDIPLKNEDVLLIPTIAEHNNTRTLEVNGEVIFPGTYAYADNMTVEDLILQAGGLTDKASTVKVDVARRMFDPQATSPVNEMVKTFSFKIAPGFKISDDSSFTLMPYDVVSVRKSPMAATPYKVHVEGEVAFEGLYTLEQKDQRLSDVVKAAGGVIDGAYTRGAQLIRMMTDTERRLLQENINVARQRAAIDEKDSLNLEMISKETTYSVGIHLDEALAHPGGDEDIELRDGDRLVIPRMNRTVRISGDVLRPNTVSYKSGKGYKHYVEQAGGYGRRARKSQAYIIYQNGTIEKASKGKIEPGCEVVVPTKGPRNQNATSQWLTGGMTAASIGAVIASILK
jgi:protein involved in polysaccharide export with SLBB domain